MSTNQLLIDQIVARVMARLGSPSVAQCVVGGPTPANNSLCFSESVLTEEILSGRVSGRTTISISPTTVLTPSARDFLRKQDITWTRSNKANGTTGSSTVAGSNYQLIVLDQPPALGSLGTDEWTVTNVSSANEAVRAAIVSVSTSGAVVLASSAEAIACEANRDSSVRAVAVHSVDRLSKAKADLRPNVFCIDPNGVGLIELRNILKLVKE